MTAIRPPSKGQIVFSLPGPTLAWLLVKIGLLNLVTLSFYRFWGKTRLRRKLWSALSVSGDPFEYTGRPIELFLGFLVALAVLTPIYGFANFAPLLVADADPVTVALVQFSPGLAIALLWPIAVYRARRYRMTRTLWRGIRFGQDGSALHYAALSFGLGLLTMLSLGLAYPWMRVALQRYQMRNTRFGQNHFEFTASSAALFPGWLAVWAPLFIAVIAGVVSLALSYAMDDPEEMGRIAESQEGTSALLAAAIPYAGYGAALAGGLLYLRYRLAEVRVFAAGTRLLGIAFEASPNYFSMLKIVLLALAVPIALMLALVLVTGSLVFIIGTIGGADMPTTFSILTLLVMAMLPFFLVGMPLIRYVFLDLPLYRHLAATLSVSDLAVLDNIVQDQGALPETGEGLADALDVGGI